MSKHLGIISGLFKWSGITLFCVIHLWSCTTSRSLSGRNVKDFYDPSSLTIDCEALVYHSSKDCSRIYVRFNPGALAMNESDEVLTHNYGLRYRVYTNYSSEIPTDSGNLIRNIPMVARSASLLDSFDLASQPGLNAVVELLVRDFNAGSIQRLYIDLVRSQSLGVQDMRVFNSAGERMFSPYLPELDSYDIYLNRPVEGMHGRYYRRYFPISSPPFSTISPKAFDFTPDKVVELKKLSDRHYRLLVDRPGFYQVTDALDRKYGATFYYFDAFYPEPKTVLSLVEPLRYISTNEEFDAFTSSTEMKKEVDAYWLRIGDNPERARELIRAYYTRVRWANQYFSSYLEGWKSDRGMCYIVFGPPDAVFRSTSTETWRYGEGGNFNALTLTFTKVVNPFTFNDFRLNRSVSLRNPWYRSVEFWRQGRVITYR